MVNRSIIAYKNLKTDKYVGIYCHWDGYPYHHLPILKEHYNTIEKIEELLLNGSLFVLDTKCNKPDGHSFANPIDGYCVYYTRDMGEHESTTKKKSFNVFNELLQNGIDSMCDYIYTFENGIWNHQQIHYYN